MINFPYNSSFDDCPCCFADHGILLIRCKYCLSNVTAFSRSYFADIYCSCVNTEKDEVCKYCKQLAHAINFSFMQLCANARHGTKSFMVEMNLMKINYYLEKVLNGSPIFYF